jgi:hypothetical protein
LHKADQRFDAKIHKRNRLLEETVVRKFFTASKPGVCAGLWTAALLLLVNCPIPLGDDWTIPDPKNRSPYVVVYELQSYVPVPVAGETPVFALDRADLKVTVAWQNGEGTAIEGPFVFERYAAYRAEITLEVQNDYLFDSERPFEYVDGTKIISQSSEDNADRHKRVVRVEYAPAQGPRTVDELDLSKYIAKPKTGWVPTLSFVGAQYIGSVQWSVVSDAGAGSAGSSANGAYKPKTKYQATVALSALSGWTFTGLKDGDFYYTDEEGSEGKTRVSNDANGLATILFEVTDPTYIEEINLQDYVPVPMAGETPVKSAVTRESVKIAVKWTDGAGNEAPAAFETGAAYRAEITLIADVEKGYVFSPNFKAAYPDKTVIAQTLKAGATNDTWIVNTEYKPSVMALPVPETNRDLSHYLPRPVGGGDPVWYFTGLYYNGSVVWTETNGGAVHGGPFRTNTAYTATVTLSPAAGYTLAGLGADFFIHNGDSEALVAYAGDSRTARIAFSIAKSPIPSPVNLAAYLDTPETGKMPPASLKTSTESPFAGTVSWQDFVGGNWSPTTGKFKLGRSYKAEVTLSAAANYTLEGLREDSFTHEGAKEGTSPSYNPDSRAVTIEFEIAQGTIPESIDLTLYLAAPSTGGTPQTKLSVPVGSPIAGKVIWTPPHDNFVAGTSYTATVILSPAEGYTLEDMKEVQHDGALSSDDGVVYDTAAGTATAELQFLVAEVPIPSPVNLTAYLDAPESGKKPQSKLNTPAIPPFTGDVIWTPPHGNFVAGTSYTATVTLNPREGYTLEGLEQGDFYHNATEEVTYNPSSNTVNIVFGEVPRDVISGVVDLGLYLPVPAIGVAPKKTLSVPVGSSFTGTVSWKDTGNDAWSDIKPFLMEGAYTATIALTPRSSYKFAEDIAFSHSGIAGEVVFGSGAPVTVTLPFEPFMPRITVAKFGSDQNADGSVMKALDTYQDTYGLFITLPGGNEFSPESIGGPAGNASLSAGARFSRLVIDGDDSATTATEKKYVRLAAKRPFIEVRAGMTVTLKNFHITGNDGNEYPVIRVMAGGTLNLENVVITGNTNTSILYPAGGMLIEGKVNMTGREVSENTFTSSSPGAGGVYIRSGGEFTMTNGKIDGNTGIGANVAGGVYIEEGKELEEGFVMDGDSSSVSDNKGSYTYPADSTLNCAGVVALGTFKMKGGIIAGNTVPGEGVHGAVAVGEGALNYKPTSKFIMSGKARVDGNNSVYGPITVEGVLTGKTPVATFEARAFKESGGSDRPIRVLLGEDVSEAANKFAISSGKTIGTDGWCAW